MCGSGLMEVCLMIKSMYMPGNTSKTTTKWRCRILNFHFGRTINGEWFIQKFKDGQLKHASHSKNLWWCIKTIALK